MQFPPPPPPYFERYSHDNLQLRAERVRLQSEGHAIDPTLATTALPPLDPPPPPPAAYASFGVLHHSRSNSQQPLPPGVPDLVPELTDESSVSARAHAVRTLVLSASAHYARLMDELAARPALDTAAALAPEVGGGSGGPVAGAAANIGAILANAMQVLDGLREHQGRRALELAIERAAFDGVRAADHLRADAASTRAAIADWRSKDP
ncbi:hypothetical protein BC828DRAFT_392703, partial [Blastocladiella britannica]